MTTAPFLQSWDQVYRSLGFPRAEPDEPKSVIVTTLVALHQNPILVTDEYHLRIPTHVFFSAVTVVKNYRALAVFAAAWIGVSVAISFAISLLTVIAGNSKELFVTLVFSSSLLWYAMIVTSMYFTFRDCFEATPGEPQ